MLFRRKSIALFQLSKHKYDTIFALSSGSPPSGVAVIRTSGPESMTAAKLLMRKGPDFELPPRQMVLSKLYREENNQRDNFLLPGRSSHIPLDQGLVVFFPAGSSFTGEDVIEYHIHGSVATVRALSLELTKFGLRYADRGEFTRRAVLLDRMSASKAEALGLLLEAETERQREIAMDAMKNEKWAENWRMKLVNSLAHVDASIDFSDDVVELNDDDIQVQLQNLLLEVDSAIAIGQSNERIKRGAKLVICGPPNAGKSSLLNFLAKRTAAIVSPIPGTTRDAVEVILDLFGYPITAVDTAGVRSTPSDTVESIGIQIAREKIDSSDLCILVLDCSLGDQVDSDPDIQDLLLRLSNRCLVVLNKTDKLTESEQMQQKVRLKNRYGLDHVVGSSMLQENNVVDLNRALSDYIRNWFEPREDAHSGSMLSDFRVVSERQMAVLLRLKNHVESSISAPSMDLCAEELRHALSELSTLSSFVDSEEILDVIFQKFCVGK